jgi:hypothetical protein
LIDRFETDDTRNRGVLVPLLRFPQSSSSSFSFSAFGWSGGDRKGAVIDRTDRLISLRSMEVEDENDDETDTF